MTTGPSPTPPTSPPAPSPKPKLAGIIAQNATACARSALATFLLVFIGCGVATLSGLSNPTVGDIAVAIAFGLALFVAIMAGGPQAQVNPAESLGKCLRKEQAWLTLPLLFVGQVVGAALGSFVNLMMFGGPGFDAHLGAALPADTTGIFTLVIVELLGTFFLVSSGEWIDQWHGYDSAATKAALAAVVLAGEVLVALHVTGGAFNPARWLGPALVSWTFPFVGMVYLLAQFAGGALLLIYGRNRP
jgi:glycerol uptake facilitator-like aquaporin